MMMPAHKPPLPDGSATAMSTSSLPELAEADFFGQVFHLAPDNAASVIDDLVTKATGLGISVSRSSIALSTTDKRFASSAESNVTVDTSHARTASTESKCSASTTLTSASSDNYTQESVSMALNRKRSRNLAFSQYDKLLAQINPNLDQPKFLNPSPPTERHSSTASLFSVSTRKSYLGIRNGILKIRRKRRPCPFPEALVNSCSACREDFKPDQALEKLPCGHSYCTKCLRIMINQSSKDETKMPPRCCTQPIPGLMIRSLLSREEQTSFLKAVQLYSTPWENRVFCSNPNCGEFIPPRARVDPKHPFQTTCRNCQNRVCIMCKRDAHPLGYDCPSDVELEAVLKIGEASGWRRCYKCRNLVELTQGCSHMTCRCRAQFCYVCGGVWTTVGCPNYCNGEEELERRRIEEAERLAAQEAQEALAKEEAEKEAAESVDAEERTKESIEFQTLRNSQAEELERFRVYERKTKWLMWTRQSQEKLALVEKQSATIEKMKERHVKTTVNLEDRQVQAELELRSSLEQSERNVRIRLKHMEAYCDGLGQNPSSGMPRRVVTERDLRELGQQYNVEKNMRQLHQAKINVMRDRQAKALEELQQRQESELGKLLEKDHAEIEALESSFADQEDTLAVTFNRRRQTMDKRWELSMRILQKELESKTGLRYSILAPLQWPQEKDSSEDGLSPVEE